MKAPAFDYVAPAKLSEVFSLLAHHGDEAQLLAGGQTLLATLNMRLSEPALLIDLRHVAELRGISLTPHALRIGALVTHSEIEHSELIKLHAPLLSLAAPYIAHRAIRNRGTWGGSIAYADPAAEWPACALALDATVIVRGEKAERRIAAIDFFIDLYTTSLAPGEVLIACEIPLAGVGSTFGFEELARRHGDYAIVGLAAALHFEARQCTRARLAFLGIGRTPFRAKQTEQFLNGRALVDATCDEASRILAAELQDNNAPLADLTNSANTKRHLAGVLLRRVLQGLEGLARDQKEATHV